MRRVAILAIVLGCGAAGAAGAATVADGSVTANALNQAAFAPNASNASGAPNAAGRPGDAIGSLLDHDSFAASGSAGGLVRWNSSEAPLFTGHDGSSDSLRIREGDLLAGPGELPLSQRSGINPRAYEVSVMHNWAGALRFDAGRLNVDVTPHAGVGLIGGGNAQGSSAEAGATV